MRHWGAVLHLRQPSSREGGSKDPETVLERSVKRNGCDVGFRNVMWSILEMGTSRYEQTPGEMCCLSPRTRSSEGKSQREEEDAVGWNNSSQEREQTAKQDVEPKVPSLEPREFQSPQRDGFTNKRRTKHKDTLQVILLGNFMDRFSDFPIKSI